MHTHTHECCDFNLPSSSIFAATALLATTTPPRLRHCSLRMVPSTQESASPAFHSPIAHTSSWKMAILPPMQPARRKSTKSPLRSANAADAGALGHRMEHGSDVHHASTLTPQPQAAIHLQPPFARKPEVKIRCVLAGRHSPLAIWSTLPARRVDLRGFTRSVGRRYLPRSNASRVSHRTWTGPRTRRVCEDPSGRHGPRSCRVGGSRGGYTHMDGCRPSRGAPKSSYWTTTGPPNEMQGGATEPLIRA